MATMSATPKTIVGIDRDRPQSPGSTGIAK
jgi:hypothetical protein